MSMTLDEMKLAVCEKLPGLVKMTGIWCNFPAWKDSVVEIHWPTEGLQVCHEAEKLLVNEKTTKYFEILYDIATTNTFKDFGFLVTHATYKQRLEALCRVWFPERFQL